MDKRSNLIYLVPFKKHVPEALLIDVPGFDTLSKEVKLLSFLDTKISMGFLEAELF